MNRVILIMTLAFFMLPGCRKEVSPPQCEPIIQKCGQYTYPVAFAGFETEQLSNIVLYRYTYDSTFIDEIDHTAIKFDGTLIKGENTPIFNNVRIGDSFDYRIEIPAADTSYYIHSEKIPDRTDTFECPHYIYQHMPKCSSISSCIWVNAEKGERTASPSQEPYLRLRK